MVECNQMHYLGKLKLPRSITKIYIQKPSTITQIMDLKGQCTKIESRQKTSQISQISWARTKSLLKGHIGRSTELYLYRLLTK